MDMLGLNPLVKSASVYETINRQGECVAYDCRLIYMISGDLLISVGGEKPWHLSPGHLLYIPAGTPYRLKGHYFRAAVICFDPNFTTGANFDRIPPVPTAEFDKDFPLCPCPAPLKNSIHIEDLESERDTFIDMCNLFTSCEGRYRERVSAMLKLILIRAAETNDECALPSRMVDNLDKYIRENVSDEISNTEIGAIFGYHPFYVSKMLKDRKGQTLRQYIIGYRMKAAKRLLQLTEKSIGEIAEETGFTDASYFTKSFKSFFGITPKEYRNSFKDEFI